MKKIVFVFGLFSLISIFPLVAQNSGNSGNSSSESSGDEKPGSDSAEAFAIIPELEAEEVGDIPSGRTKVVFKTNVKSCAVFLNGNLQGRTNLTLSSLVEGYYLLRIEKDGYNAQENFVYVENAKAKTFYVEMQPNEETQKRIEARQERAAQREAENAQKNDEAAKNESQNGGENAVPDSTSSNPSESGIGDAK